MLDDVGFADVLLVYESEREDGKLVLVDGHMRAGLLRDEELPVVVLDITDEEADKLLMTIDPIAAMAETAKDKASVLVQKLNKDIQQQLANVPSLESVLAHRPTKNPMEDFKPKRKVYECPHCGEEFEV